MKVSLMHGAGGEVMGELLKVLTRIEHNNAGGIGLEALDDGAVIPVDGNNIVFTTDSHVVRPIFFPGGDIGRISICGTVNDLGMMGGKPIALSCGMIIEEGFEVSDLERIVRSMDIALGECGASLVTGDTKVLEQTVQEGGSASQVADDEKRLFNNLGFVAGEENVVQKKAQPMDQ